MVSARILRRWHTAGFEQQPRMPDRFDCAKLVGTLRSVRPGRTAQAMQSLNTHLVRRDHGWCNCLDPPFDTSDLEPRLYQWLCAGSARKWRAIHPCGDLGSDGVRPIGRQRTRVGIVRHDEPDQPRDSSAGPATLQSRAVCDCCRRVRGCATHRARRLDMVHRLGRLDVPADYGIVAGLATRRRQLAF